MAKASNALVIVESPAKAKTIEKYLGGGYKVVASMGHLRDLPRSKLGVDIEHDFTPEYIPVKGREAAEVDNVVYVHVLPGHHADDFELVSVQPL